MYPISVFLCIYGEKTPNNYKKNIFFDDFLIFVFLYMIDLQAKQSFTSFF